MHRILVLNPTEDMIVMQREIFGPILPIKTYADRQEVADDINSHDRPLAIYPFTHNAELRDFTSRGSCRVAYRSMKLSCTSASTTCLSVGSGRAAWAITTRARGSTPFQNCARSSTRALSRRLQMLFQPPLRRPRNERPADDDQMEDVMRDVSMSGASGHGEEPMADPCVNARRTRKLRRVKATFRRSAMIGNPSTAMNKSASATGRDLPRSGQPLRH